MITQYFQSLQVGLPETVALAAVALIGYMFGKRTRRSRLAEMDAQRQHELDRAAGIARHLESIACALRLDLASHHGALARFRRRITEAQISGDDRAWQSLCTEAELVLAPTLQLAHQLSLSYDAIRQQSDALEAFTQARIDPTTGVGNLRALEERLAVLIVTAQLEGAEFSIAMVSLDRTPDGGASEAGGPKRKSRLTELARLIQSCMRKSDFLARYGDEEFVVLMPHAKLVGAAVFAQRLRDTICHRMSATASCGVAEYQDGDHEKSLLGRADSALYSAKAAGGNRQFAHTGAQIREQRSSGAARVTEVQHVLPVAAPPAVIDGDPVAVPGTAVTA